MKYFVFILSLFPLCVFSQTDTVLIYSLGEYANNGITIHGRAFVQSSDPALQGNGAAGPGGTAVLCSTTQTMALAVNSLHQSGWLGTNGHPYFCGQQCGVPYITGNSIYDGIQDSAGSTNHFFTLMSAGWNNQDGEEGWFVAWDTVGGGSLWVCGDLKNGVRGNGTTSSDLMKWVQVPLPTGLKVRQLVSAFTNLLLCDTVSATGTVLGQRVEIWGVSGTYQSDYGYGTPTFGQSAGSYNGGYNMPHEILISGQHAHNIRMIAGGLDCNYLVFDSLGVQRFLAFGIDGWRMLHSTTVSADPLNTPTDITSKLTGIGKPLNDGPIDTVVVDAASTHILVGSGTTRELWGWSSTEQGTLGNGLQYNYATYSPPYDNGGANENLGGLVQFTPVQITPGKTNWQTLLNGGFYAYADQAMDQNGDWFAWGRNKPAYLPVGTKPIDGLAGNLASVQPQGWQRAYVTKTINAFAYSSPALSTSQGCYNACTAGPVTGSPCSLYTPTCYTTHAALSATSSGNTIYLNATSSTSTGFISYVTFFQTAGTTTNMGVQANPVNKTDTITGVPAGSYTFKVIVQDANWGVDSTTATVTVGQTGFYFDTAGSDANACTFLLPCKTITKFNSIYATLTGGDTCYFSRGETFVGEMVANSSGSSGNPIVVKPYGSGNLPVIGGRTALTGWVNVSGNVWKVNYTGPQPNILQHGDTILTQTTYPDLLGGWLTPTSMTTTSITDAVHAGMVTIGSKIMIRSSQFTIDTAIVTNVSGGVITFSPATYSGIGANGWKVMNITPYENGQYQDTLGQVRIFSIGSPTGNWNIPSVDTPLLSEGTWQEWDSLWFKGGNNAAVLLAFQATGHNLFNADSVTDSYDGFSLRTEGNLTVKNCVLRHFTDNGVWKTNTNNYNNSFVNDIVYDAGLHPGLGRPGANQGYSGIIAGDSGSIVLNCTVDSIGYIPIANYGNSFSVDSNLIYNFCLILEDGGGIYTYQTVGTSARRKILNNIIFNGGSSISNLGCSLNHLVAGIYTDNYSNNILIQGNGISNVDFGFYDHGYSNSFLYNVVLNARSAQQFFGEVTGGPVITGIVSKNNVFGYTSPVASGAYIVQLFSVGNDLNTFCSACDTNYYLLPIGVTTGLYTQSSSDVGTNRGISSWRSNTGYDIHTQYLNRAPLFFVYSTTGTPQSLYGIYKDVYSNVYNGTISIGAYLSAMLQRVSLPTIGPIVLGGQIQFH